MSPSLAGLFGLVFLVAGALPLPRVFSLGCFWAAGVVLVGWLAVVLSRDRPLVVITIGSFVVRSALAVALYEISARSFNILRSLQLPGGFWTFAPDAAYYDSYGRSAALAMEAGLDLPFTYGAREYCLLVAALYRTFGRHALYPILLNAAAGALTAVLGFLLASAIWSRRAGRVAAIFLGFWPSMVLWSTQLLRDTLIIVLLLLFAIGLERFQRTRGLARVAWGVELGVALVLTYRFRFYVGAALALAGLVTSGIQVIVAIFRRRYLEGVAQLAAMAFIVLAVWTAVSINPERLGAPRHPLEGYRRLAVFLLVKGDEQEARAQLMNVAAMRLPWDATTEQVNALAQKELEDLKQKITEAGVEPGVQDAKITEAGVEPGVQDAKVTEAGAKPGASDAKVTEAGAKPGAHDAALRVALDVQPLSRSTPPWFVVDAPAQQSALTIRLLQLQREAFLHMPAASVVDADVKFTDAWSIIAYLPRGLVNAALTPNPFNHYRGAPTTGNLRDVAVLELPALLVLYGCAVLGFVRGLGRAPAVIGFLAAHVAILAIALGLIVPTVGLLFRFRLGFVVPLCVLAGGIAGRDPAARSGVTEHVSPAA